MTYLYIAGPMRSHPEDFNFPAFDAAAKQLREAGYAVKNPADMDRSIYGLDFTPANADQRGYSLRLSLAADLDFICRHANGIAVLPGWRHSAGAQAEVAAADALGLVVLPVERWLWKAQLANAA